MFSSEGSRAPQYNLGVTAPKDGYGAQQPDSTDSETVLLLTLGAFPAPQDHEILEKKFSSGSNKRVVQF